MMPAASRIDLRNTIKGEPARKTVTFANTTGTVNVFTITGDVIVRIIAVCKTSCASAGGCNIEMGVTDDTDAMIAATDITTVTVNRLWHDTTPDSAIEAESVSRDYIISNGASNPVILTLSAQADSGAIDFTCLWIPVSAGATVVAA